MSSIQQLDQEEPTHIDEYRKWLGQRLSTLKVKLPEDRMHITGDLALRLRHILSIGGTAVSAIFGANPYRTAYEVYQEMNEEAEPFQGNYVTRRGIALEQLVAKRAAEILNRPLFMPAPDSYLDLKFGTESTHWIRVDLDKDALLEHEDFVENTLLSMYSCQIDALTETKDGKLQILECKTASRNPLVKEGGRLWGKGIDDCTGDNLIYEAKEAYASIPNETMPIPFHYFLQVQWQLLCLENMVNDQTRRGIRDEDDYEYDFSQALLAADIAGSNDVRIYVIPRDSIVQQDLLFAAYSFFKDNIMKKEPPSVFSVVATPLPVVAAQCREDDQVEANAEFLHKHLCYKSILKDIDNLKSQADKLKEQMLQSLIETGEQYKEVLDTDGSVLLKRTTYKTNKFNQSGFKKDHPDLFREYMGQTEQTRVTIY